MEAAAEAAMGADWRPPGAEWTPHGDERRLLNLAVTQSADAAAACARVLATWSGAGVIDRELECNALLRWFQRMMEG
eukprot:21349-Prymnesium_polylepis.1